MWIYLNYYVSCIIIFYIIMFHVLLYFTLLCFIYYYILHQAWPNISSNKISLENKSEKVMTFYVVFSWTAIIRVHPQKNSLGECEPLQRADLPQPFLSTEVWFHNFISKTFILFIHFKLNVLWVTIVVTCQGFDDDFWSRIQFGLC